MSGSCSPLSSTTSTQESGLSGYILPIFRAATGLDVHVVAVGTGQALAIGMRGDADALLVHDRIGEDKFVAEGYGIDRRDVMYNDVVIVGKRQAPIGGGIAVLRLEDGREPRSHDAGADNGRERKAVPKHWQRRVAQARHQSARPPSPWPLASGRSAQLVLLSRFTSERNGSAVNIADALMQHAIGIFERQRDLRRIASGFCRIGNTPMRLTDRGQPGKFRQRVRRR